MDKALFRRQNYIKLEFTVQCKLTNKFIQRIVLHSTQLDSLIIFDFSWNGVDISVLEWCMYDVYSVHLLTWDPFYSCCSDGRAISVCDAYNVVINWNNERAMVSATPDTESFIG